MKKRIFIYIFAVVMLFAINTVYGQTDGDYEFNVVDGKAEIYRYTGNDVNLVIPETLGGYPVDSLDGKGYCMIMGEIAQQLKSVVIPDSVTRIGRCTFYFCHNLEKVTMSKNLAIIESSAFYCCCNLKEIWIPKTVTDISATAFGRCDSLKTITIQDGNPKYYLNGGVIFDRYNNSLAIYPCTKEDKLYTVPSGIKEVGYEAFCGNQHITSVVLPDSVTRIDGHAFDECSNLSSIKLSKNLNALGNECFSDTGLTTFEIPSTITSIGNGIFAGCEKLTKVVLPDNMKVLPRIMFWGCTSLTNLTLPSKLEEIDDGAFGGCVSLKSLVIPSSVQKMERGCFSYWKASQNICFIAPKAGEQFDERWNEDSESKVYFGALPLVDVLPNAWYFNAVKYAYNNKIVNGTGVQTFSPNSKLTRGMLVTILYGMEGAPKVTASNRFSDVSSSKYYYRAVLWASSKGIVNGSNGKFKPDDNITRQDLAVILMAYSRYKGKYVASNNTLSSFSDRASVSSYALPAIKWAAANKIINGSNGRINPKGTATRAEAVTMIYSYILKFGR